MELVKTLVITSNRFEQSDRVEKAFQKFWKCYVGISVVFQAKVAIHFERLLNEPLWNLYLNDGKDMSTVTRPYSVTRLRENTYASLIWSYLD